MIELNKKTQQEFELKFDTSWNSIPFEDESYQLQIEEDLGESVELLPNDEGIEELTSVHKYKVKKL